MSGGQEQDDGGSGGGAGADPRLEVLNDYTLKTMKVKNDKWAKVVTNKNYFCISG